MIEETFLRLQHSEGIVCETASRLLAAYISSGQLNSENESELVERSVSLAIKLAEKTDRAIESDDENGVRD
jgi:hypothetical protein